MSPAQLSHTPGFWREAHVLQHGRLLLLNSLYVDGFVTNLQGPPLFALCNGYAFEQGKDIKLGCGYYLQRSQVVGCGEDENEAVKGSAFFNPFEALDVQAEGHQSAWHAANCLPRGKDTTLQYKRSSDLHSMPRLVACSLHHTFSNQHSALSSKLLYISLESKLARMDKETMRRHARLSVLQ